MISTLRGQKLLWIDLHSPEKGDFAALSQQMSLHPMVLATLRSPVLHPRLERFADSLFLIVHIPVFDEKRRDVRSVELDIVIGNGFIITSHEQSLLAIEELQHRVKKSEGAGEGLLNNGVGNFLYTMLSSTFDTIFPTLDALEDVIEHIEGEMFREREKEVVSEISILHRNIIDFRRAINPVRPVLEAILEEGREFFEPQSHQHLKRVVEQIKRMMTLLEAHRETIAALEQTNQALLTTKTNEIIKALTAITAVSIPFIVLASIWGMNVLLPLSEREGGLTILLFSMALLSFGMLLWFRKRKWL